MPRETNAEKAIRLFRAGRVRRIHGDVYEVQGDTKSYRVDLFRDGCECPAGANHRQCAHVLASEILQSKLNVATARRLERLRAERLRRPAFGAEQVARNIERIGGAA